LRKQVLVTVDRGETRVAMLEAEGEVSPVKSRRGRARKAGSGEPPAGYRVAEIYLERRGQRSIVGNIYEGKVDNVIPGLEAAFVDIGLDKNGFLHVDEVVIPGVDPVKRGRGSGPRINELLQPGQDIVVQVVKDPLKTKGARLSMEITIAGRYMVYAPTGEGVGVSRRLEDKERDRLRKEAKQLSLNGGGAIIRTAAQGAQREDFERELGYLFKLNEVLQKRVEDTPAPALVFQEADLSVRVVRDIFSEHFERAVVDDPQQHHRLVSFFSRTAPELVDRVELWEDETPLFEAYGVEPVIHGMLSRRVDLPSGGYLIIDYAEALTVVDVNSGSFTGKGKQARLEDTITKTNLEAAEEVVRQLRLRDIGGIIVIDFIDMARARNRDAVLKTLRNALDQDRTKTFVVEISPLGLVEMTRQNVTDGVREIMTKDCPTCDGEGVIKSEETIAIEFERRLRRLVTEDDPGGGEAYLVRVNPKVSAYFTADAARVLTELEDDTGRFFHFEGSEGLPLEHFTITKRGTRDEIMEQAVPFRAGEEVHVNIVEPHMYNADDAVAKVDSYVIEVVNGIPFVGQKKLVLIEEAGRTAARAVLTGEDAEEADRAAQERAAAAARARRGSRGRRRPEPETASKSVARSAEDGDPGEAARDSDADTTRDPFVAQPSGEGVVPDGAAAPEAERLGDRGLEAPSRPHGDVLAEALPAADAGEGPEGESDEDAEAAGSEEAVESRPRRRGRRGGRRRSRAKADADADDATEVSEPSE
jgi:ribonuclease G